MTYNGLYDVRDLQAEDAAFVYASFMRGIYYGNSWFSLIPKTIFMTNYKKVIEKFVNGGAVIKVACLKEDSSVILGYSILSEDYQTVHWVFVKNRWRKHGIGKSLVPAYPTQVTHLTELGKQLLPKLNGAIFNPFA